MKVSFFHDAPLIYSQDGQVYSIGFTYNIWERYLTVFDSLVVSTRMRLDDSSNGSITKNMKLSSGPRVEFKPVSEYGKNIDMIFNRRKISNQVKETLEECDCAIIRLPSFIGGIACKEAKKMGKPYLIEVVGCAWDAFWNHSLKGKLIAPYCYLKTKKLIKDAHYAVYVTNEFLQKRYPTNGKTTNCSNVALAEFDHNILEKRLERIRGLHKDSKLIIGTAAAVDVRYKGQQYVIRALGKLKEQGITNYEYQLVGGGEQTYLKSIAKKYNVSDQVKFLGSIPHNEVFKWLDTIDIYVQPSRQEGLPRALIEAMSRGLPAFGANTAGIPELLESEYIFSNTRKNINEICSILKSFDKYTMKIQAKRNYDESKKYDKGIIEERREEFFLDFKNNASKQFIMVRENEE